MLAHEIKSRLRQAQVRQRDIACRCRVSNTAVCLVIAGKSVSRRIQTAVAEAIGLPVDDVFPPGPNAAHLHALAHIARDAAIAETRR